MVLSVKKILSVCLVVLVVISLSYCCVVPTSKRLNRVNFTVVIDAGHGGIDGGAVGSVSGVSESSLNLKIAYNLKSILDNSGFTTILTRTDENGLYGDTSKGFKKRDLEKRVEITKKANPDIFISVHLNTYQNNSRRGAQVFYKKDNENAKKLATNIQLYLNLLKESKRMYDCISGDYYLLNNIKTSAVIVECGFLSNLEEENLLLTNEYREKLAKAIFNGIVAYLLN